MLRGRLGGLLLIPPNVSSSWPSSSSSSRTEGNRDSLATFLPTISKSLSLCVGLLLGGINQIKLHISNHIQIDGFSLSQNCRTFNQKTLEAPNRCVLQEWCVNKSVQRYHGDTHIHTHTLWLSAQLQLWTLHHMLQTAGGLNRWGGACVQLGWLCWQVAMVLILYSCLALSCLWLRTIDVKLRDAHDF